MATTTAVAIAVTTFLLVLVIVIVATSFTVIVAAAATVAMIMAIVVMVVFTMNVAVLQLLRGRRANGQHFDIEVQILAGQHMIAIHHHFIAVDEGDFHRHRPLVGFRQETHTHFKLLDAHKDLFRDTLDQIVVLLAVGIVSQDMQVETIADITAGQRVFQS